MEPETVKVVLLGESGVGKTCIITQFTEHKFEQSVLSSLSAQFVSKTIEYLDFGRAIKFDIWDTVGQERFRAMAKIFYKDAKVIVFVYDITSQKSFDAIQNYWYNEIKNNCGDTPVIALVGNKLDLYDDQKVDNSTAKELAKKIGAIFQLTSAKNNDGITSLFDNIGKKYLQPTYDYDANDNLAKEKYKKKKEEDNNTRIRIKMNGENNSDGNEGNSKGKEKKGCC